MQLALKPGVLIDKLTPQMLLGALIIYTVYSGYGHSCTITSGNDSKHSKDSLHYSGNALDIRTSNLPADLIPKIVKTLKANLGALYDVVLEGDHIHVEWDPK